MVYKLTVLPNPNLNMEYTTLTSFINLEITNIKITYTVGPTLTFLCKMSYRNGQQQAFIRLFIKFNLIFILLPFGQTSEAIFCCFKLIQTVTHPINSRTQCNFTEVDSIDKKSRYKYFRHGFVKNASTNA